MYFGAAISFMVGFYGLLRPSEIVCLKVSHLGLPSSILLGGARCIVIMVDRPKTRRHLGRRQFGLVDDADIVAWVEWYIQGLGQDEKIFPGSGSELRGILKEGLRFLGLEACKLVLAGLRTGGATFYFRRDQNLGKLQFQGRRRAATTLHYLQEGMTAHLLADLPAETEQFLLALRPRLDRIRRPPVRPSPELIPWRRVHHGQ